MGQKTRVVAEVVQQGENVIIFQLDDRQGDERFDDDFYQVNKEVITTDVVYFNLHACIVKNDEKCFQIIS